MGTDRPRIDANLPVQNVRTQVEQADETLRMERLFAKLLMLFASLAQLLAAIGLYGVLAYTVSQRTREIGVRMALGADSGAVRRMVLRQVSLITLVGGVIGMSGAVAVGRSAQSLLFEMKGTDPTVLIGSAALLVLVAFAAGLLPAQKAARIDPMIALRYE